MGFFIFIIIVLSLLYDKYIDDFLTRYLDRVQFFVENNIYKSPRKEFDESREKLTSALGEVSNYPELLMDQDGDVDYGHGNRNSYELMVDIFIKSNRDYEKSFSKCRNDKRVSGVDESTDIDEFKELIDKYDIEDELLEVFEESNGYFEIFFENCKRDPRIYVANDKVNSGEFRNRIEKYDIL